MKLRVGDKLQLQPPHSVSREKFTVKLIGYLERMSLLITAPTATGLPLPLLKGEKIVVRAFSGQHAFGFVATIEHICKSPYEYLHVSFPQSIEGLTIRRSPRIQITLPASVFRKSGQKEPMSCVINNLSLTGALVSSESLLGEKGDVVSLAFEVSALGISSGLSVDSIVRSISETPSVNGGKVIHSGLEFKELRMNERLLLGSYIYEQST
ncbi:MAG TPA: flagellar brake protein [Burkholderiales bacterium]|nr:flagellar brake protein [Burkholderiales bacterium]